uniref:Uncharacterized protein n=1 Tax=Amphora coffeiformis TaxID=265554 RepID=A0A7S3KYP3_9STRA|mmetsp:Transcript_14797/g.28029  ORF Transcript_14797/g.28029 Transcript_14797/m.28029 type:complete len:468 (-) Transcript_14797:196-1599(-)|eukprot:scaffold4223_cov189-Amphora_coffeaeformis.AAC.19
MNSNHHTNDRSPSEEESHHHHHQVWNALVALLRTRGGGGEFAATPAEQIWSLQSILEDSDMTFQQAYTAPCSPPNNNSNSNYSNPREWNLLALALLQSLRQQLRGQYHPQSSLDVVRWMLDQGANPWCASGWLKFSAWELVVWHNHVPALRLLLETHEQQQKQQVGNKEKTTKQQLQKRQSAVLAKTLRMALEMGHWEAARLLLPYDTCLPETGNILHWTLAEANRYFRVDSWRDEADADDHNQRSNVEQWLPTTPIDHSSDQATTDNEGSRPYHHFSHHVLRFVLKHGTDPVQLCRQARADGATPLHVVGPFVTAAHTILQTLLQNNDHAENLWPGSLMGPPGYTILHSAVRFPDVLKLFLTQLPPQILSIVNQYNDDGDGDDDTHAETPLALACRLGAVTAVQTFLQHGSNPMIWGNTKKNHHQPTADSVLSVAAQGPSLDVLYLLLHHAVGHGQLLSPAPQTLP